jgi:hypothetical protein
MRSKTSERFEVAKKLVTQGAPASISDKDHLVGRTVPNEKVIRVKWVISEAPQFLFNAGSEREMIH